MRELHSSNTRRKQRRRAADLRVGGNRETIGERVADFDSALDFAAQFLKLNWVI